MLTWWRRGSQEQCITSTFSRRLTVIVDLLGQSRKDLVTSWTSIYSHAEVSTTPNFNPSNASSTNTTHSPFLSCPPSKMLGNTKVMFSPVRLIPISIHFLRYSLSRSSALPSSPKTASLSDSSRHVSYTSGCRSASEDMKRGGNVVRIDSALLESVFGFVRVLIIWVNFWRGSEVVSKDGYRILRPGWK